MKSLRFLKGAAVCLASLGLALPQTRAIAAGPSNQQATAQASAVPKIIDVSLQQGGTLKGHVVDAQGQTLEGAKVSLRQQQQEVATTVTNKNGEFAVGNLKGGVYRLSAGQGNALYRLWAPGTAPPIAQNRATLVSGEHVVRGSGEEVACPHGYAAGCPQCSVVRGQEPSGIDALDIISLTTVAAAVTAAIFAGLNHGDINDLEDKLASP